MVSLNQLILRLHDHPHITEALTLDSLTLFIRLLQHLKEKLCWTSASSSVEPPIVLPPDVTLFLEHTLCIDANMVAKCWLAFRDIVWSELELEKLRRGHPGDLFYVFMKYGVPLGVGFCDLYPPTRTCFRHVCTQKDRTQPAELKRLIATQVVLFTREFGPVPVWSHSACCRHCGTRYYPTFYISEHRAMRNYYAGVPQSIQVTTHSIIEASLCEHFTQSMVFAWVSATNAARIYNLEHRDTQLAFPAWSVKPALTTEIVWDAFFLFALLRDHDEHDRLLTLGNSFDLAARLEPALRQRTLSMAGPGQENWNHACNTCCAVRNVDGHLEVMRAVVMDSVSVNRPCCGVHDCQGRLPSQRSRFCQAHQNLDSICCIVGCTEPAQQGFRTCSDPIHRDIDDVHSIRRTALFQLRKRLERMGLVHLDDSTNASDSNEALASADDVAEEGNQECEGKSDGGNVRPRAQFGRKRTHNEQLCVAVCGVILGRATFFGSEGANGARLYLKGLFPTTQSLPQVIFYDNACSLQKHIQHQGDHHFDGCAMPVDVFHMKIKHKISDDFCGRFCNPALFPDLIVNGQWRFNSSAAEMTNAWFGGFGSITREMREERYDFFLDEMIKQRNRSIVYDLEHRGAGPYSIPRDILLP